MVSVRVSDKRTHKGYRIEFFNSDKVTDEVVQFVQKTPKAYWIDCVDEIYYNRDDFLKKFKKA